MAKNSSGSKEDEPSIAPQPERWYNLRLGHSFRDHHPSSKFCTLRYEFKPASVDKNQPGSLHKKKDNRVTVEFHNNQHGKPKVIFEGVSEDYKENDAVLFFDGETFRLERLHRAVKRLRHVRIPGESATPAGLPFVTSSGPAVESHSPPPAKVGSLQLLSKAANQQQVEVEKIGTGSSDHFGTKCEAENIVERQPPIGSTSTSLPDLANYESEEHVDIVNENDYGLETAKTDNLSRRELHRNIDINVPQQNEEDEIADVDVSDDEVNPGYNAAEALRAQVAVEREEEQSSSSSSSSGSESSDSGSESGSGSGSRSGSGSSSSDSESSDGDSVMSI